MLVILEVSREVPLKLRHSHRCCEMYVPTVAQLDTRRLRNVQDPITRFLRSVTHSVLAAKNLSAYIQ
jgi:hypothetical protein